jgi:hypothetical protein
MPRFFFRVADSRIPQPMSAELPNLRAVRLESVKSACRILAKYPEDFWSSGSEWQMTVTDEAGLTLFTLIFYAAEAPALPVKLIDGERRAI